MTPGVRTIPAAMVLPTAAAMPNHTPRTCNNFPGEILLRGRRSVAARAAALGGTSGILGNRLVRWFRDRGHDNGGDGKYKAEVIGNGDETCGKWQAVHRSSTEGLAGSGGE